MNSNKVIQVITKPESWFGSRGDPPWSNGSRGHPIGPLFIVGGLTFAWDNSPPTREGRHRLKTSQIGPDGRVMSYRKRQVVIRRKVLLVSKDFNTMFGFKHIKYQQEVCFSKSTRWQLFVKIDTKD